LNIDNKEFAGQQATELYRGHTAMMDTSKTAQDRSEVPALCRSARLPILSRSNSLAIGNPQQNRSSSV